VVAWAFDGPAYPCRLRRALGPEAGTAAAAAAAPHDGDVTPSSPDSLGWRLSAAGTAAAAAATGLAMGSGRGRALPLSTLPSSLHQRLCGVGICGITQMVAGWQGRRG